MAEISKKEIEHVASLARIKLAEKEKQKIAEELGAILSYIDKLKEVNTDDARLVTQNAGLENVLRKDEPSTTLWLPKVVLGESMKKSLEDQVAKAVKLVEMAPDSKGNFVKVHSVISNRGK
ncbi:MAG: Asp-tRNA(Asn)/Glu-tRNA(Gln) amidotransferase subunit GatC [Candidatus Yanofskybacteria bacterium]|nr:Asp-tRNA(Asn)/Glu-tRNA(Gln) amidotransferase subunit GatC [Candidatus Yanofskybacteria bacterium]